ncbi:hypothetical protein, partial [Desulfobacter hydrogenophilus]|uniref:hypothetical protein n=1 Tax=Desulfobacter hydrogenophilus TaxID=2291 RepID=UPI001BA9998D
YIGERRFESGHKGSQNVPTKRGCRSDTKWPLWFGFIRSSLRGEFDIMCDVTDFLEIAFTVLR